MAQAEEHEILKNGKVVDQVAFDALLETVKQEWEAIGLSTDQSTKEQMRAAVDQAYRCAEQKPPNYYFFLDSPRAGALMVALLCEHYKKFPKSARTAPPEGMIEQANRYVQKLDKVPAPLAKRAKKAFNENACYGQHDAREMSRYDFFARVGVTGLESVDGLKECARHCGWWWPMAEIAVITAKTTGLHYDDEERLHCETGQAISYADGWGVYCWHGKTVPKKVILDPNSITDQDIAGASEEVAAIMRERRQ